MKQLKNIQVWLVLLTFIITLIALFGGRSLSNRLQVTEPLRKEMAAIKAVKKFKVDPENDGVKVTLNLGKVANLQDILEQVEEKVEHFYNKPVKAIVLVDHSNLRLRQIRYQLAFNLEEARVSGRYVQLKSALDSYRGVKARVYFSRDYFFIQLEDGPYYHYEAVPRLPQIVQPTGGDPA